MRSDNGSSMLYGENRDMAHVQEKNPNAVSRRKADIHTCSGVYTSNVMRRVLVGLLMALMLCLSSCRNTNAPSSTGSSSVNTVPESGTGGQEVSGDESSVNEGSVPGRRMNWGRFLLPDEPVTRLHCLDDKGYIVDLKSAGGSYIGVNCETMFYVIDVVRDEIVLESDAFQTMIFLGTRRNGEYVFLEYEKSEYQLYDENLNFLSSFDYPGGLSTLDRERDCILYQNGNTLGRISMDGTQEILLSVDARAEIMAYDPEQQLVIVHGEGIDDDKSNEYSVYSLEEQDYVYTESAEYAQYDVKDGCMIAQQDQEVGLDDHGNVKYRKILTAENPYSGSDRKSYVLPENTYTEWIDHSLYAWSMVYPEYEDNENLSEYTEDDTWDAPDDFDDWDYEYADGEYSGDEYIGDEYEGDTWGFLDMQYYLVDVQNGGYIDLTQELNGAYYTIQAYAEDIDCILISGNTVASAPSALLLVHPDKFDSWLALEPNNYEKESDQDYALGDALMMERAFADQLERQYGVTILIGNEVYHAAPNGYYDIISTEDTEYGVSEWGLDTSDALEVLDRALACYSEDFFKVFRNYRGEGGLRFLLVQEFENPNGSFVPGGLFYNSGAWYNIVIDVEMFGNTNAIHHEMWHAVEQRICDEDYLAFDLEQWNSLNPSGYEYDEDFDNYYDHESKYEYLIPWDYEHEDADSVYFVDIYGTVTPYEDRATLIENLLLEEYDPELYGFATAEERIRHYPHLNEKLGVMADYTREVFGDVYWE